MFENLTVAPPDPILGISEAFAADAKPNKINLTVGVFKDESGATPILASVKEAERRLLSSETTKNYLGIEGLTAFNQAAARLALGESFDFAKTATLETPGGTGACRVAADFLGRHFAGMRVWMSNPTWANHQSIFQAGGLQPEVYTYLTPDRTGLDLPGMLDSLNKNSKPGDGILLHACCHNPTGIDPDADAWKVIARETARLKLLPIVDFAYQGFGDGLEEDTIGIRSLLAEHSEMLLCSSFSKNFGLYSERVGAVTLISTSPAAAKAGMSQLKQAVRCNYSNPPRHGASVVATILNDADLKKQWTGEVDAMRGRIHEMRELFVSTMNQQGADRDFSFLLKQKGMFSYSGLNAMQADWLRSEYGIYIVGTGRINVAGMTRENIPRLCEAIAAAIKAT